MLPPNITRSHIVQAIERINEEGIPAGAESNYYDVVYNQKHYPPKYLVSLANELANGVPLDRNSFEGGINTECFDLLDKEGFELVDKQTGAPIFFEQLIKFLQQAQLNDLKTSSFIRQFRALRVKVSFGQGYKSNVPWIAILKEGQEVQKGIYPVYLYAIDQNILILAYGVSETKTPDQQWSFTDKKETIKEYFLRRYHTNPFRYGYSYVYKVYDLNTTQTFGLNAGEVVSDIDELIKQYHNSLPELPSKPPSETTPVKPTNNMQEHPLNTILYGPPGTGKTFNSINHALAIIKGYNLEEIISEQKANPESRLKYKQEFDELVKVGQIDFVTFHQSYAYEEFVEGIKPKVNGNGHIEYNIEDGIFKTLCLKAQEELSHDNFDEVYERFYNDVLQVGGLLELETPAQELPFKVYFNSKRSCVVKPGTKAATPLVVTKEHLRRYVIEGQISFYPTYVKAIGEHLKRSYPVKTGIDKDSNKKYVLIIDEINRGNISKIFGELITLIEPSKRMGEKEELRLKLAYSGSDFAELFGVPNNLYLIGTMNSTDRSIALIDTALRRRFTFVEYSADPTLLNSDLDGINLPALLDTINKRIEFLLDKDHLIGHAYFMDVSTKEELGGVFRNKLIPLLEEYFYGDYEKIQLVLGDNKAYGKQEDLKLIQSRPYFDQRKLFGFEVDGFEEKKLFTIHPLLKEENYKEVPAEVFTAIYLKQAQNN